MGTVILVSYPDPPPKRNGGSGEYSAALHCKLLWILLAFVVACWASANLWCAE